LIGPAFIGKNVNSESLSFLVVFGKHILPRAPNRVQKLATNEFRRLTIDASAAQAKQEKSLVAELEI
jgi:hypothetical protein